MSYKYAEKANKCVYQNMQWLLSLDIYVRTFI